jgi:hypothetical protein
MFEQNQSAKVLSMKHSSLSTVSFCRIVGSFCLFVALPWASRAAVLAHWSFNESGGAIAHDSVGSYNGTLSPAGASFSGGGISGNAISLNRALNGFVSMGNVLGFTSQPFSIVAWLKTAPGYSTSDSAIVSKHAAFSQNGFWLMANQAGGGGQTGKAIFGEGASWASVTSTSAINDGNWHQIVAVFNPNVSLKIYVDGAPSEASFPASSSLVANNVSFLIGGVNNGPMEGRLTGLVDEVQVYNHVLSDGEINFLYQNPSQIVPEPGIAAFAVVGLCFYGCRHIRGRSVR